MNDRNKLNSSLVRRLKEGDESAYGYMIDVYDHRLCLYANSLVSNILLAEDIVQNVYLKVWEKRHKLNPELSLTSFLFKSVYNDCITEFHKNKQITALKRKYIEELDAIFEDKDQDSLERLIKMVTLAIQELPPKCKQIFLLSKKEGLTHIEIAEYLNLSPKTIERHITMAFSRIRKNVRSKTDIVLFVLFGFRQSLKA
ncbi:MAG: sigma-70 family RNA polymerase sigma factor [Flavobacteriaceae bacterium]|nr:sigma-70 family RNA polymerase sigma factor [Flavobacteriaceae bacterium]